MAAADVTGSTESRSAEPITWLLLLIAGALAIRLIALWQNPVINSDGVLYLYQAKSIYLRQWGQLTACSLPNLSVYPVAVAVFYPVVGDWIAAGRVVSILCGVLTIVPVYLLFRLYFQPYTRLLGTAVYALMPFFVYRSTHVLRDPLAWLFLTTGLYLFLRAMQQRSSGWQYTLVCLLFLLATWSRIECILYLAVSLAFSLVFPPRQRMRRVFFLALPIIAFLSLFALNLSIGDNNIQVLSRAPEILDKFTEPIHSYQSLRNTLKHAEITASPPNPLFERFLSKTRTHIWIVGVGELINAFLEGVFYPYACIILMGLFAPSRTRLPALERGYLYILIGAALFLLYTHLFQTWVMEFRFLAIAVFPCFFLVGRGIEALSPLLQSRLKWNDAAAAILLCAVIVIPAAIRNVSPHDKDKAVFQEVGQTIAMRHQEGDPVTVLSSFDTQRWVSFYANQNALDAVCPLQFGKGEYHAIIGRGCDGLDTRLAAAGVQYLLYEERNWPVNACRPNQFPHFNNLHRIGEWRHPDTGRMSLYAVRSLQQ
jgi:4-amino-4-deoxy-L-arabinose transferase-like glycosyltransferase